jgi:ribosomal protein L11 methyltransferase
LIRLAVRCPPEQAEPVLAQLLELAPNGVEEERGPGWVEYAIYGAPGEVPDLGQLQAAAGDGVVEVSASAVPDDWADRWADFHRPIEVADRIRIRPSWERPRAGLLDVVIDPGQAFGTGAHPTTRLCVELLAELAAQGVTGSLADWGTGSGVLAISAAKLGWRPVLACDREPAALETAARNARANGVEIELSRVDVRETMPPSADTVVANLTAPLLGAVAARIWEAPSLPSRLVCSGMLASESDVVSSSFEELGFRRRRRREERDWSALLLTR